MKEANALALRYCKDADMQDLFSEMRKEKKIKKSDLEEAIFCFENKKWKACILILFGLIDAKLIRLQNWKIIIKELKGENLEKQQLTNCSKE